MDKIAEKAVYRSVFDNMALYWSTELTITHSFRLFFFGDFAHWDTRVIIKLF